MIVAKGSQRNYSSSLSQKINIEYYQGDEI